MLKSDHALDMGTDRDRSVLDHHEIISRHQEMVGRCPNMDINPSKAREKRYEILIKRLSTSGWRDAENMS